MKTNLVALLAVCVASQSCTIVDTYNSRSDVNRINRLVKVGDNIREARKVLIENEYLPTEIKKPTVTQDSYRFTVTLSEFNQLDSIGYGMDVNLNPWRNGVKHWVAVSAGLDEVIYRIYDN